MVNTTVMYNGQQIQINLPDNPSLDMIYKCLNEQMPKTFNFRTHIVQLFDPTIGEFFDLNDDGLRSWVRLPLKEKLRMRLQIIRAGIDYDDTNENEKNSNDNMSEVFLKIEHDIETLFSAIENLQVTANGIRQDFKTALEKYNKYQQEKVLSPKPNIINTPTFLPNTNRIENNNVTKEKNLSPKIENGNTVQPIRYPSQDIRFKNKLETQNVAPIPVKKQVPLVSNAYENDDDDEEEEEEQQADDEQSEQNGNMQMNQSAPVIDIETPLLQVGEDFQALVSIAVNPSYFFVQNTLHTHDLEQLAQSMNDYYSTSDPPSISFKPMEMSCCAARYSVDNRWYRARIKRYSSETTVELVYLDYGNNEERNIHELRPLDPAFARLPAQAICAALELLPVNGDNNSSWTKKASFKFHEDTLTKPLDVRITAQPTLQWPMYFVQLTIDQHTDVAETLISIQSGRRASLAQIVQIVGPRLDLSDYAAYNLPKEILQHATNLNVSQKQSVRVSNVSNTTKHDNGSNKMPSNISGRISRSSNIPSTTLNLTDNIGSCTITSLTSPSHFFIQFTEKNNFEQIYNSVNETYLERISCDRMTRLKNFSINTLGVARNTRDQRFYRVQIINHDRERKTLLVLCFDFGEYITIQETSIYELIPEFLIYPPQSIKCSLGLIHPTNEDWSRESVNLMNRFIGGKGFKTFRFYSLSAATRTISLSDPPLPIILYDMNTSDNSLNEQLITKKLAIPETNYIEYIRLANDAMNDLNGFKNQRIRQYIESQRNYTQPQTQTTSSLFIERNPIDVRYEQPQKQQNHNLNINTINIETLPLPENEENLPYCPPVIEPELKHWYAVEVTYVKSAGEFYIRYPFGIENSLGQANEPAPYPDHIEPNIELNELHRNMADFYGTVQRRSISTAASYCTGQMVAVRYQSHWHRALVLEFKPSTNFAWVQFVDQGEKRELGTNTMRPLDSKFLDLPLQAYLCHLDGFDADYPWTTQDQELFKKKIRDKILYARKIREPNSIKLVEHVDGEIVSFDSFWKILHHANKSSESTKPMPSTPINRITTSLRHPQPSPQKFSPMVNNEAPVRNLQPVLPGIVNYASGSEYSQTSAAIIPKATTMKKSSGVTIPPPPPSASQANRQPMQFISAGFKQPVEYAHLSPSEQLAQLQQQENHRIQPTGGYSINKHFRQQQ
ncbi:unnamed protein product [Adineta steineri]|uniref:Tudor domain-containing protein n=2 Tax=Adineta steineri TaxID=433720 RepID=A0A815NY19_9BILA|nr:unnamed protein product [Adineta steineri]CAF1441818.1 unnamed protein product [Adineta steineri]